MCVCVCFLPSFDYKKTAFLQLATLSLKYSWILAQFWLFFFLSSSPSFSCSLCYFLLALPLSPFTSSFWAARNSKPFDRNHFSLCSFLLLSPFGWLAKRGWRIYYMKQTKLNRNDSARKSIVSLCIQWTMDFSYIWNCNTNYSLYRYLVSTMDYACTDSVGGWSGEKERDTHTHTRNTKCTHAHINITMQKSFKGYYATWTHFRNRNETIRRKKSEREFGKSSLCCRHTVKYISLTQTFLGAKKESRTTTMNEEIKPHYGNV